MPGIDL
jgi:hypothetical protein